MRRAESTGRRAVALCWCAGALLALLGGGCERERRVPYIPPELHDWPAPYRGRSGLRLHVFEVGSLRMLDALVVRGGSPLRHRDMPVWAYVLEHPARGLVVLDTGVNHGVAERGEAYLGGILGMTMSAHLNDGQELPAQMKAAGLRVDRVRTVVLSNLRFYHAGEVEAFREAQVIVSRGADVHAAQAKMGALPREYDDVASWKLVDVGGTGKPLATMSAAVDLFDDGSLTLIRADGPTAGNLAFLLRLRARPVLLAGDLAPVEETVRYAAAPRLLADADVWWDAIWRLKRFKDLEPKLLVVPGHEAEPLRSADLSEVRWHEWVATGPTATPRPAPTQPPWLPLLP